MTTRTINPIVTGGSVVALKYAGGVLVATDMLASYGSLAVASAAGACMEEWPLGWR